MVDRIDYKIHGDDMQVVEVELDPGEGVRAEAGAMMFMEDGMIMQTSTGGGMFKGFKRMVTGESFFITTFLYTGKGKGRVTFGAPYEKNIESDIFCKRCEGITQKDRVCYDEQTHIICSVCKAILSIADDKGEFLSTFAREN